MQNGERSSVG